MNDSEAKIASGHEPWLMTDTTLHRVINDDKRRSGRTAAALSVGSAVAAAGLTASALVVDQQSYGVPLASMLIVAGFLVVAAIVLPVLVLGLHRARKRRWERRQRECKELAAIADTIDDPALGHLISFNFRLMDRFVAVAIEQARASYLACSVAATAALLVLLAGATTVLTVQGMTGQIIAGTLTGLGAALSSYLSVTFLWTFQMTSKQMSYYYGQPLVHCYLLHAEWLGKRFEEDADPTNRWKIRHQLIHAVLDASRNAQDHLLDLQLGTKTVVPPVGVPTPEPAMHTLLTASELSGNGKP